MQMFDASTFNLHSTFIVESKHEYAQWKGSNFKKLLAVNNKLFELIFCFFMRFFLLKIELCTLLIFDSAWSMASTRKKNNKTNAILHFLSV